MVNLVVQTAFLGDLLLSIPLLKQIKLKFPEDELHVLCRKGFGDLIINLGLVDKVFEVNKGSKESLKAVKQQLKEQKYRYIFSPHQSFRSALFVSSLSSQESMGFSRWWNRWFFSRRRERPMNLPDALRQLSLLTLVDEGFAADFQEVLSLASDHARNDSDEVVLWDKESIPIWAAMSCDVQEQQTEEISNLIFFAPGSVWETKKWGKANYISLGQELVKRGHSIAMLGSPEERELCEEVARGISDSVKNFAGETTLLETLKLMKRGEALVCNDSGAMHLAAVVGLPSLSLFGPTTLNLGYRPWQSKALVVQNTLDCRPCGLHGAKSCPLGHHNCMVDLAAVTVLEALEQHLLSQ